MLGLSIISYEYIETPLRRGKWFRNRWKRIVSGGGVIVTLSGILITLEKPLKGKLFTGETTNFIKPTLLKGEDCLENTSEKTQCFFIDNKSSYTLWMLGDSHTDSLYLAGEVVANSLEINLKLFRSTIFPPIKKYRKANKETDLKALNDFRLVEKELYRKMKNGDIIFLSIRMPYHFGGTYYEYPPSDFRFIMENESIGSQENHFDEWISSVFNLASIAEEKGAKIIIQTPTPEWEKEQNKLCSVTNIQWFNRLRKRNCQIKSKFFIDEERGLYKHLFKKINQLSTSHRNIYLFDTYKVVCPESKCSFTRDGVDIYYDDDHLSYGWARDFLAPEISKFINEIQTMEK